MLNLIPTPKSLTIQEGFLPKNAILPRAQGLDPRLALALTALPTAEDGIPLTVAVTGTEGESYELSVTAEAVTITAPGPAGAFWGIQTLRQLLTHDRIPCLTVEDAPEFAYRGFYHDVTRGKVPTVDTLKKLIDEMAYYKLNSLQLYVEHVYEFEECKDLIGSTGYLSAEEIRELDRYCADRFVEFIPSLSTFGHLFELLNQPQYRHLQVLKDYKDIPNFWNARMGHHTIDPLEPESIQLISSLIDQYEPLFTSDTFNICCDETFDLKNHPRKDIDTGKMYVDFVKQIIAHTKSKGKKVMMWADILLQHPEVITDLPEDTVFLNWTYGPNPNEDWFSKFAELNRTQIVCPGTSTWSRFCENVEIEEQNICKLAAFGKKYNAMGMLNTNWGDWGNPCSLELAMYGMVLGAQQSWTPGAPVDDAFYNAVNVLLYDHPQAIALLKTLSQMHSHISWNRFARNYFALRFEGVTPENIITPEQLAQVQALYNQVREQLQAPWLRDEYRQEMLLAAEGICILAELAAKLAGQNPDRITDPACWLRQYREKWVAKNKESELRNIEEMFNWCESH